MWWFRCFHPRKLCWRGGDGSFGMAMLKMAASCFSAAVCFYPSYGMGMDGAGFWRDSVRSADTLVTASDGERLGNFFWNGKSSVVLENRYNTVLGIYDVIHL